MECNLISHSNKYFLLSVFSVLAFSANVPSLCAAPGDEQFILQQQRQQALQEQLTPPVPDVRLSAPTTASGKITFPLETPCFRINHVTLRGQAALPHWLPLQKLADRAVGKCLGSRGINLLMSSLQNRIIYHGWTTTRVLAPAQDLKSGDLQLAILPGKIRHVVMTPQSSRWFWPYSAFPAHDGNLLDLRDIEQGLENLQRLPTVQAEMEIVPAEQPGESDIVISRQQSKFWRLGLSLDDSGTVATGRYQGGVTLSLDNPLALSDLFWFSLTHDLQPGGEKSNQNLSAWWSVPVGWWSLSLTGSDYHYHQTVAGLTEDYRYAGKSQSLGAQLSRVLHRSSAQKTTLTYDVQTRTTRNYINDTEVEVQRRHVSSWKAGLQHRHFIGPATLDAGLSYQRGTRWFGAQPAPEELFDEGTALGRILRTDARLSLPFALAGENFRYDVAWQRQTSTTPLTTQDQFSIGGRWTVRGFDGERTLNADRGWTVRNDLSWRLPLPGSEFYLAADYGEVAGKGTEYLVGNHLAGGAAGLRGNIWKVSYDLFAGVPFSRPEGFKTSPATFGFSLNMDI
ncbi:ShlB/FhaC/HecB family hemolysin secretion/activation protein [Erwinia pyri]|uniref:ShlB/FhaC/HecB family hemolysin secretion/activation protein n=1 Tax=Erwinia pyri TaxID=3062598 RepID=A0AA50DL23_9GAMM|nr:ShlB/FhaC/HecB family hemolysin secretion/activation protein [Erwinia sp. DE2]WLS79979.1 ShlB/FhaC/HecB family hemolysin secretion/activation protein [Erwinia sp. DE2]